jgi:hypothetical protein
MAAGTGLGLQNQPAAAAALQLARVKARIRVSADWFFWIAGLSILNTVIMEAGGGIRFIVGLGITEVVDAVMAHQASGAHLAGWIVNLVIAGVFALFGKFGREGSKGAFIVGMVLYAGDALLMANFKIWLGVAFHAYALYRIYLGMAALNQLESAKQQAQIAGLQV